MMPDIGFVVTERRVFSQNDFDRFAALSGDDNPIHVDPVFAKRTRFRQTVSHGMLLYTALCGALQTHFGGAQQLEQDLMFPNPTYAGDELTLRLAVVQAQPDEELMTVDMQITKATGEVVCQGQTRVRWTRP